MLVATSGSSAVFGRIHIVERGRPERVVELLGTATIGRTADNDIVLDSDGVSHCHAMLLTQPGGVVLLDLGSTFGTFVDTVQALPDEPVRLADGARINIGRAALRYAAPRPAASQIARATPAAQPATQRPLATPHLNTRFEGVDHDDALRVGRGAALLVWVGAALIGDGRQSSRPLDWSSAGVLWPLALRVGVRAASAGWRLVAEEPTLRAEPWGTSQVARYRVVPLRPERSRLGVSVHLAESGALLQHFKLGVVALGANGTHPPSLAAVDPLQARCPHCGTAVRLGARFCVQCGDRL